MRGDAHATVASRAGVAIGLAMGLALGLLPALAWAHGFGARFDLPIPMWLWLAGAGLTLVLSFAAVIDFLPAALERIDHPRHDLLRHAPVRLLAHPFVGGVVRVLAVLLFLATIVAGLAGNPEPDRNLAPTMVWVVFWVGMAFASAFIGDVWQAINPLGTLFDWADALSRALRGRSLAGGRSYPAGFDMWPAVAAMLAFGWGEHVWGGAAVPWNLGVILCAYTALTVAGMLCYGRDDWLQHGEVFTVMFGLFARFAPLELRRRGQGAPVLALRPPAVGLLEPRRASFAMVVFVLLTLSLVTYDGFKETSAWQELVTTLAVDAPALDGATLGVLGLFAFPLLFLLAFLLCCWAMRLAARAAVSAATTTAGTLDLAGRFVCTLVPIAIAYHVAHYLSLLGTASQLLIPLASDPLGRGWDLFGTAAYVVDPGLLGVRTVWYLVVTLIVVGHVFSVYLSHLVALDVYAERRAAIWSQVPMLVLMVAYTMTSLWILAQPIVG
ncbi:MAG: hypothetical protein AB7Q81_10525 [Gammaproteobacteria bacterium]